MSWSAEFGVVAVPAGTGAALRLLAATARAHNVVEVGTGLGVSGLWLLQGMRPDGVLTTIDVEPDHQAMARQTFAAAGYAPGRTRLIAGAARRVLPRLADAAYDLVFVDGDVAEHAHCVGAASRLLRDGGLLVVNNATAALGGIGGIGGIRDAPEWTVTLLPTATGLLCAVKNA